MIAPRPCPAPRRGSPDPVEGAAERVDPAATTGPPAPLVPPDAPGAPGPAVTPPSPRDAVRLLALDPETGALTHGRVADLPSFLRPGDLVVVNDAATMPASLRARGPAGEPMELRLVGPTDDGGWRAVLFGAGDFRTPTEHRPAPPLLSPGDRFTAGDLPAAIRRVSPISARLVDVAFDAGDAALLSALYARGRAVQYAHHDRDLALGRFQTAYAARPWAAEMPSAGRPLTWAILFALRRRGVEVRALTHAAGLSATGDPDLDAALPLPERYEIPAPTAGAVARCLDRGGRVIAVGTTVVRALEGAAAGDGTVRPGAGETDLVVAPGFRPRIVSGLVSGLHAPEESHFRLLSVFAPAPLLETAWTEAGRLGYRCHEFGDLCLLLPR